MKDLNEKRDIRVFYLMNGQIVFAEFRRMDEDTGDFMIRGAVSVMIAGANGASKQIGMSTAFPFTHISSEFWLNKSHVTSTASLDWNKSLMNEYDKFWEAVRAAALKAETGIEIVPGNANLQNLRPVPGGQGPRVV